MGNKMIVEAAVSNNWEMYNSVTNKILGEYKTLVEAEKAWEQAVKENRLTKQHVDKDGFNALHFR
jgi:hypothetical protein